MNIFIILVLLFYILIFLGAIGGISYFVIKRLAEKKAEKEILEREDY